MKADEIKNIKPKNFKLLTGAIKIECFNGDIIFYENADEFIALNQTEEETQFLNINSKSITSVPYVVKTGDDDYSEITEELYRNLVLVKH